MASLDELLHEIRRIEESRVTLTEKRIKSIYKSLEKDLSAFIAEEYVKYADKDGHLFLTYLGKNKRAKFLEEIVRNVDGISPQVKGELIELVNKTYEKAYKGIVGAVKKADDTKELLKGVNTLVSPEVLNRAVRNNIEKLTLNAVMEKHRAEIIADIQQTLTTGLMNGDRYETMARRIQERLGVSYSKASNIARTEAHRNTESGMLDGAKETSKIIDKDGGLIYAATWKTMRDQRVRPQQRRKTKKGWVTTTSKNGANHVKMEGVTIKVGEKFQLEPDVFAECPGMSGTARNDCRCRCFLRYSLMTVEEFAKATGQTEDAVRKKYRMESPEEEIETVKSDKLSDAETYSQKFAKSVSFGGAKSIDDVSLVVNTLNELTTKYPIKKLSVIKTNGRLRSAQARANYECLEIKPAMLSGKPDILDWQKHLASTEELLEKYTKEYLGNPRYDQKKVKQAIKKIQEERKYSRWTVSGGELRQTIMHEYGHIIADQYIGQINSKYANPNFSYSIDNALNKACRKVRATYDKAKDSGDIFKISMYANSNEHEFFAETFTMYASGEKLPDYITEMLEEVLSGGIL